MTGKKASRAKHRMKKLNASNCCLQALATAAVAAAVAIAAAIAAVAATATALAAAGNIRVSPLSGQSSCVGKNGFPLHGLDLSRQTYPGSV